MTTPPNEGTLGGVGQPGDPELVTIKAARVIAEATSCYHSAVRAQHRARHR
jgi:precorrin-2 methylase